MRVAPTLDRSLRIDAESATDWLVLEMICTDASQTPNKPLADQLADYMSEDEDWIELITPELADQFSEQVRHVSCAISAATKESDLTGSLFIEEKDADTWFGAINQARLSLEERYTVSKYDDIDDDELDNVDAEIKAAVIRYHFYTSLQTLFLQFIFE